MEEKTKEMQKSGFILVKSVEPKAQDHGSYIYYSEKSCFRKDRKSFTTAS